MSAARREPGDDFALGQITGEAGNYFVCIDPAAPVLFVGPFVAPPDATELVASARKAKAAARAIAKVTA